jgi:hypothetical protein
MDAKRSRKPTLDIDEVKATLSELKDIQAALREKPSAAVNGAAFRRGVANFRKATDVLGHLHVPSTPVIERIDTAFLIWTRFGIGTGNILVDSHTEALNNWATIRRKAKDDDAYIGGDELNFYFLWQNTTGADAVVNVSSYLALNGWCQLHAESSWFWAPDWAGGGLIGDAHVAFDAVLTLFEWWNQPPTEPLPQVGQRQGVLDESISGGWSGVSPGQTRTLLPSGNYHLNYDTFFVPRNGVAVFEVGLQLEYDGWNSSVNIDFASEDLLVLCPYVQVELLTAPGVEPPTHGATSATT